MHLFMEAQIWLIKTTHTLQLPAEMIGILHLLRAAKK